MTKEENAQTIIPPQKKARSWRKLLLMGGFLCVVYYIVWNETNNPEKDDGDGNDGNDEGKDDKDKKNKKRQEKDGYLLLNNNEDYDI